MVQIKKKYLIIAGAILLLIGILHLIFVPKKIKTIKDVNILEQHIKDQNQEIDSLILINDSLSKLYRDTIIIEKQAIYITTSKTNNIYKNNENEINTYTPTVADSLFSKHMSTVLRKDKYGRFNIPKMD